jgi:hypothetical protein
MDRSRPFYPLAFAALHVLFAFLAAPDLLLRGSPDVPTKQRFPMELGDVRLFYRYATAMTEGRVPYRDFHLEYPILAVPFFLLPRLAAGAHFHRFTLAFAGQMLAANALTVFLVARRGGPGRPVRQVLGDLVWYTLYFFLMARFIVTRFDPLVMLFCFGSAFWWFSAPSRSVLGGVSAGLGALVKIVPGLAALPGVLWEATQPDDRRGRGTLAFVSVLALGIALWLAVAGRRFIDTVRYHLERDVEIGSLYSGVALLIGGLTGTPVPIEVGHGSYNLGGRWSSTASAVATAAQASALSAVLWQYLRTGLRDGPRCVAALLFAFVAFSKVFSPQFLIWLIPFAAAEGVASRVVRPGFLACCLLTAVIYSFRFNDYLGGDLFVVILNNLRNLIMLGLFASFLAIGPSATRAGDGGVSARTC